MMLVALAGPLTNMLLALLFAGALCAALHIVPSAMWRTDGCQFVLRMLKAGVVINFSLAWLNLLPIPPLDGSRILGWLLPDDLGRRFQRFERYGFVILILLLATGALSFVLKPLVLGSADFALYLVSLTL
jgi:Zn-dependent protease